MSNFVIDLVKETKEQWGPVKTLTVFAVSSICFLAGGIASASYIPDDPVEIDFIKEEIQNEEI